MCQFTRIPMTRLNVSFMLQNFSQFRLAVREGHNGGPIQGPLLSPSMRHIRSVIYLKGFRGGVLKLGPPVMPRGVSIAKSCTHLIHVEFPHPHATHSASRRRKHFVLENISNSIIIWPSHSLDFVLSNFK